jgi:hypothetical protein
MEHELWIDAEFIRQSEAAWVFLSILCKLLTQPIKTYISRYPKPTRTINDTNLINILSNHLNTSGLSSISALNTAIRAIKTAAAS